MLVLYNASKVQPTKHSFHGKLHSPCKEEWEVGINKKLVVQQCIYKWSQTYIRIYDKYLLPPLLSSHSFGGVFWNFVQKTDSKEVSVAYIYLTLTLKPWTMFCPYVSQKKTNKKANLFLESMHGPV